MNDNIKRLKELIDSHNNIVFFGGAGVSTESDIPDFRSASGLFNEKLNRNGSITPAIEKDKTNPKLFQSLFFIS